MIEALERKMPRKEPRSNVEFYQAGSPFSAKSFGPYKVLAVRVVQSLKYGQRLFIDYGNNSLFN